MLIWDDYRTIREERKVYFSMLDIKRRGITYKIDIYIYIYVWNMYVKMYKIYVKIYVCNTEIFLYIYYYFSLLFYGVEVSRLATLAEGLHERLISFKQVFSNSKTLN